MIYRKVIIMLDEFYLPLYHDFFLKWIILNKESYQKDTIQCQIEENNDRFQSISFEMSHVKGLVTVWYNNIVEEELYRKENNDLLFYLHYTIVELSQCCHLFNEFYQTMIKHNNQKPIKIAMCCSGGLSTSIFVDQMKEVCELENIPFEFYSLSIEQIYKEYQHYQALYLAPQIAYYEPNLLAHTKRQIPIHCIDPTDFATKDYRKIIKTIQNNYISDAKCYHKR